MSPSPTASREPLRFYFDYISPNAYIAWTQIHDLARRNGREVDAVPVLFAALLGEHGLLGPAEVKVKWRWMIKEMLRKTSRLGIPLEPPPSHPFNPLLGLRVSSLELETSVKRRLIDALFRAVWAGGPGITDAGVVAGILDELGLNGAETIAAAGTAETKEHLRQQTATAVEQGVFGVPTVVVEGELFWGYDDFMNLETFLRGDDPLGEGALAAWHALRPSATRE